MATITNKSVALKMIEKGDVHYFSTLPRVLQEDKDIALALVKIAPFELCRLSRSLKADREVVLEAVKADSSGEVLDCVEYCFRKDKEIVLEAVKQNGKALYYSHHLLRDDVDIVFEAVSSYADAYGWASDRLKNDRKLIIKALENGLSGIGDIPKSFMNDKEIALLAVRNCGKYIYFFSDSIKNDDEVVYEAMANDSSVLSFVGPRFRSDRKLALRSVKKQPTIITEFDYKFRDDLDFIAEVIDCSLWNILHWASDRLKNDRELVCKALAINPNAFGCISRDLKQNKEFTLEAIKKFKIFHRDIDPSLRNDEELLQELIKYDEHCLEGIKGDFIKNDTIMYEAFSRWGTRYYKLLNDKNEKHKEIILSLVEKFPEYGEWLANRSEGFSDKDFMIEVIHRTL